MLNPGLQRTLQSTCRIEYLAVICFSAAVYPRVTDEVTLTLQTYRIGSVLTTWKATLEVGKTKPKS